LTDNQSYELYGVLVHLGYTSHSGHYYSYVKGPDNQWYKADDHLVKKLNIYLQCGYVMMFLLNQLKFITGLFKNS
jgi:ubiquitin C-terminal hydrolase